MFCNQCGEQLTKDAKFCSKCGNKIFPADDTTNSTKLNNLSDLVDEKKEGIIENDSIDLLKKRNFKTKLIIIVSSILIIVSVVSAMVFIPKNIKLSELEPSESSFSLFFNYGIAESSSEDKIFFIPSESVFYKKIEFYGIPVYALEYDKNDYEIVLYFSSEAVEYVTGQKVTDDMIRESIKNDPQSGKKTEYDKLEEQLEDKLDSILSKYCKSEYVFSLKKYNFDNKLEIDNWGTTIIINFI